jgi:hypothetical protein
MFAVVHEMKRQVDLFVCWSLPVCSKRIDCKDRVIQRLRLVPVKKCLPHPSTRNRYPLASVSLFPLSLCVHVLSVLSSAFLCVCLFWYSGPVALACVCSTACVLCCYVTLSVTGTFIAAHWASGISSLSNENWTEHSSRVKRNVIVCILEIGRLWT